MLQFEKKNRPTGLFLFPIATTTKTIRNIFVIWFLVIDECNEACIFLGVSCIWGFKQWNTFWWEEKRFYLEKETLQKQWLQLDTAHSWARFELWRNFSKSLFYSIIEQPKTHKILFFHFFLVEKQKIQLQTGWNLWGHCVEDYLISWSFYSVYNNSYFLL